MQWKIYLATALVAALSLPAVAYGQTTPEQRLAILNTHNVDRALHCVTPLQWSDQLAANAQAWANQCRKGPDGVFIHQPGNPNGENLSWVPEAVADYVGADNPVRFIDAFVDGLDLAVAGFRRVEPKATGRPGYALRNAIGHSFFPENRRQYAGHKKVMYQGENVYTRNGIQKFEEDFKVVNNYLLERAFGA
ncbi:MAG TPA: CAP domain-containing protein [Chthoniobacterales bacterium]